MFMQVTGQDEAMDTEASHTRSDPAHHRNHSQNVHDEIVYDLREEIKIKVFSTYLLNHYFFDAGVRRGLNVS